MNRLLLYARSLRHLRPAQIVHRLFRNLPRPAVPVRPAPPMRAVRAAPVEYAPRTPQLHAATEIELLNLRARIDGPAIWRAADKPKLWLYQLHYFDDLVAANSDARRQWHRALIDRWIAENPPGAAIAWDPYPTSLRVVNWIKWHLAGNELGARELASLAQQVRYLVPRLEHHLMGNHLLENYKTLLIAGCFFAGEEAEGWRARGLAGLRAQVAEQVLPDGAHNELAPMYHSIIAEGLLDAVNVHRVLGLDCPDWLSDAGARMVGWGTSIEYPDGEWPQLNDSALHGVARPAQLVAYLQRLGYAPRLAASALRTPFERRAFGNWTLLADLANLGPDHNPGHGHADNLTYELCVGDRRLIVDTGISTYEVNDIRAQERSTAAHNTVVIDGENSSEVWQSFRVGRRAYTTPVVGEGDPAASLAAEHDGYQHREGAPIHRREWQWSDQRLLVLDTIRTRGGHELRTHIHLHPDYNAELAADGSCVVNHARDGRGIVRITSTGWTHMSVIDYEYAPGFGKRMPAQCVELTARCSGTVRFRYKIEGL